MSCIQFLRHFWSQCRNRSRERQRLKRFWICGLYVVAKASAHEEIFR
jgi:hypothetical protein